MVLIDGRRMYSQKLVKRFPLKMIKFLLIATFVSCNSATSSIAAQGKQIKSGGGIQAFQSIGSIGDKEYFIDSETRRTWEEALGACVDAEYELATVDSPDESTFLTTVANLGQNDHWTAGRDAQEANQNFVWAPGPASPAYFPRFNIFTSQSSLCVELVGSLGPSFYRTVTCASGRFTLCQSRTTKI